MCDDDLRFELDELKRKNLKLNDEVDDLLAYEDPRLGFIVWAAHHGTSANVADGVKRFGRSLLKLLDSLDEPELRDVVKAIEACYQSKTYRHSVEAFHEKLVAMTVKKELGR